MAEISNELAESIRKIAESLEHSSRASREMTDYLHMIATGIKAIDGDALTKSTERTTEAANRLTDTTNRTRTKLQELFDQEAAATKKTTETVSVFDVVLHDAKGKLVNFGKSLTEFDGSFKSLTDSLSNLPVIGGLAAGFGALSVVIDSTINSFRNVAQAGLQFENGMLGFIQTSGEFGLSLEKTSEVFRRYSSTIQRVGAPAFSSFVQSVRTTSDDLYAMGFTYQDIIDSSSEFLETQRNLTGLRVMNEEEQKMLFNRTVKEFHNAAQITGLGVQELLKSMNETSNDPRLRMVVQRLPEEGKRLFEVLKGLDPQLSDMIVEGIQKGGLQYVESFQQLAGTSMQPIIETMMRMVATGDGDITQLRNMFQEIQPQLAKEFDDLMVQGRDGAATIVAIVSRLANNMSEKDPVDPDATDETTRRLLELQPALQNAFSAIRVIFLEGVVELLSEGSDFGTVITDGLTTIIGFLKNKDNIQALKDLFGAITNIASNISSAVSFFQSLFGSESPLTNILITGFAGLAAAWAAKAALVFAGSKIIGSLVRMVFGKVTEGLDANGNRTRSRSRAGALGGLLTGAGVLAATTGAGYLLAQDYSSDEEQPPTEEEKPDEGEKEEKPDEEEKEKPVTAETTEPARESNISAAVDDDLSDKNVDTTETQIEKEKDKVDDVVANADTVIVEEMPVDKELEKLITEAITKGTIDNNIIDVEQITPKLTELIQNMIQEKKISPELLEQLKINSENINPDTAISDTEEKTPAQPAPMQYDRNMTGDKMPSVAGIQTIETDISRTAQMAEAQPEKFKETTVTPENIKPDDTKSPQLAANTILDFDKKMLAESEETLGLIRVLSATAIQMAETMLDVNKSVTSSV